MGFLSGVFKKKELEIGSPATGTCVSIKEVPDPTFSEEILGKGVAVKPSEGKFLHLLPGLLTRCSLPNMPWVLRHRRGQRF